MNTWQFNFKFDKKSDKFNQVSLDLLIEAGINFEKLAVDGIDHNIFREKVLEFKLPNGVKFVKSVSLEICFGNINVGSKAYISVILKQSNDTRQLTLVK